MCPRIPADTAIWLYSRLALNFLWPDDPHLQSLPAHPDYEGAAIDFMYRERGVLIGYLLCGLCAQDIFKTSKKRQTSMHDNIERNLISAYQKHLASLDA